MPPSVSTQTSHSRSHRSNSQLRRQSHGRSVGDHDGDNQGTPPLKRPRVIVVTPKRRPTDEYGVAARVVTRIHKANWEPLAVVNAGIGLLVLGDDGNEAVQTELASAFETKQVLYNIFYLLCDRIPGFSDSTDWDSVRSRLDDGKNAAWTEDNHKLKINMPTWKSCKWDPPLDPASKHDRGLSRPQCARLLAPISVNWDNEDARHKFLNLLEPPMSADELWPAFMYEEYKEDVEDLSKGLLRSAIVVRAAKAIIFPPSIANAEDKPDHRLNRRTKAQAYNMDGVTPGFLAYVAVLLRFALSSEHHFHNTGGEFDYDKFYDDVVDYLEDPDCKPETSKLIDWWNHQLFPHKQANAKKRPESMVARLRRQAVVRQQGNNK